MKVPGALVRTLLVAGISCAGLAACDADSPAGPGRSPSPGAVTATSGATSEVPPSGPTGSDEADHLTIVFTPSGGGCIADGIRDETFTLRAANEADPGTVGAIVEREVTEQRDADDPCAWDVTFSFGQPDTAFLVSDESNGVRWGPFSYGEMEGVHFSLRLTGEPRFNEP